MNPCLTAIYGGVRYRDYDVSPMLMDEAGVSWRGVGGQSLGCGRGAVGMPDRHWNPGAFPLQLKATGWSPEDGRVIGSRRSIHRLWGARNLPTSRSAHDHAKVLSSSEFARCYRSARACTLFICRRRRGRPCCSHHAPAPAGIDFWNDWAAHEIRLTIAERAKPRLARVDTISQAQASVEMIRTKLYSYWGGCRTWTPDARVTGFVERSGSNIQIGYMKAKRYFLNFKEGLSQSITRSAFRPRSHRKGDCDCK